MERIQVVTDSSADLTEDEVAELGITIIPLIVTFGEKSYEETALSKDEFWRLTKGEVWPKTSQPPMGVFQEAFQRLVDRGYRVLCATITGRHSGTFNTAWSAAQAFGAQVTVVDSLSVSWGLGWQVKRAAQLALQGVSMDKIIESLRSLRERTHIFIHLDTVENLRRGGRAAKIMPAIDRLARALRLKPMLNIVEGELKLLGVSRSYRKSIVRITQGIARLGPVEALGVIHIRCQSVAEQLADELARVTRIPRERIPIGETGAVLACHAGEGVIAAIGIAAE